MTNGEPDEATRKGAAVFAIVAGAITALATLGPWITVQTGLGDTSSTGISGWSAWAPLVCGIVAVVAGACDLGGWKMVPFLSTSPIWLGGWAVGWNIHDIVQVNHRIAQLKAQGFSGSLGVGLELSTAAAVALILAGVVMRGGPAVVLRELWAALVKKSDGPMMCLPCRYRDHGACRGGDCPCTLCYPEQQTVTAGAPQP